MISKKSLTYFCDGCIITSDWSLRQQAEREVRPPTVYLIWIMQRRDCRVCLGDAEQKRFHRELQIGNSLLLTEEIMIRINGENIAAEGMTIAGYLSDAGYDRDRVAVEINGIIVPKADYDQRRLAEGDSVEVVSFVGGG